MDTFFGLGIAYRNKYFTDVIIDEYPTIDYQEYFFGIEKEESGYVPTLTLGLKLGLNVMK